MATALLWQRCTFACSGGQLFGKRSAHSRLLSSTGGASAHAKERNSFYPVDVCTPDYVTFYCISNSDTANNNATLQQLTETVVQRQREGTLEFGSRS